MYSYIIHLSGKTWIHNVCYNLCVIYKCINPPFFCCDYMLCTVMINEDQLKGVIKTTAGLIVSCTAGLCVAW